MQYQLRGKNALITGGSRGIGRAIALGLASHGGAVVIGYLKNDAPAREVVKTIADAGGKAAAVQADLSRPTEVTRLFDEAERTVGALDIVVANAADIVVKPLAECTEHRGRWWSFLTTQSPMGHAERPRRDRRGN